MYEKRILWSTHLTREYHVDIFQNAEATHPPFSVICFGGSGIDAVKYERRSRGPHPEIERGLSLESQDAPATFLFVTAPFDLPINQFLDDPDSDAARRWSDHTLEEILGLLPERPFYVIGYSGGFVLGLLGLTQHPRCFGCGGLGPDGLRDDLEEGSGWRAPARLFYNKSDQVWIANQRVIDVLSENEVVECYRQLPGGHPLADYVSNNSFGGQLRHARGLLRAG